MKHHLHVWTKIFGTVRIGGVRFSRYWACTVAGCKAVKRP
jgi:hypothetical protein